MATAIPISPLRVRPATAADVPAIFDLKQRTVGERYLRYTIYQTHESVRHLAALAGADSSGDHDLFVVEGHRQLAGYYLGSVHNEGYLLNYIATAPESRSTGMGRMLLDHFHRRAIVRGYTTTLLNVFASNQAAFFWYQRAGYRQVSEEWLCRLKLSDIPLGGPDALAFWPSELARALRKERELGFSKLDGSFRGMPSLSG